MKRAIFRNSVLFMVVLTSVSRSSAGQTRGAQSDEERVYLLSATPSLDPKLRANLYRIDPREKLTPALVRTVSEGPDCVLVDYDRRKLVVASPPITPMRFAVVNMDVPSKEMEFQISYNPEELAPHGGMFLLDLPQGGAAFSVALRQGWKQPFTDAKSLKTVRLDAVAVPPEELPFDRLKFIDVGGRVGGGIEDSAQTPEVFGDPLQVPVFGPGKVSTGLQRPPELAQDAPKTRYWLAANNSATAVVVGGPRVLDVLNKRTGQWRRIALSLNTRRVRAFGPWIAAILEEPGWYATQPHTGTIVRTPEAEQQITEFAKKNAGAAKRRTEVIGRKLTVDDFFDGSEAIFPGKLTVYNALSDAIFEIPTGQADSEVVLVSDNAVFYRVNDELYRAAIRGGHLGSPAKLASGPEVFQVHWAFLSRGGN